MTQGNVDIRRLLFPSYRKSAPSVITISSSSGASSIRTSTASSPEVIIIDDDSTDSEQQMPEGERKRKLSALSIKNDDVPINVTGLESPPLDTIPQIMTSHDEPDSVALTFLTPSRSSSSASSRYVTAEPEPRPSSSNENNIVELDSCPRQEFTKSYGMRREPSTGVRYTEVSESDIGESDDDLLPDLMEMLRPSSFRGKAVPKALDNAKLPPQQNLPQYTFSLDSLLKEKTKSDKQRGLQQSANSAFEQAKSKIEAEVSNSETNQKELIAKLVGVDDADRVNALLELGVHKRQNEWQLFAQRVPCVYKFPSDIFEEEWETLHGLVSDIEAFETSIRSGNFADIVSYSGVRVPWRLRRWCFQEMVVAWDDNLRMGYAKMFKHLPSGLESNLGEYYKLLGLTERAANIMGVPNVQTEVRGVEGTRSLCNLTDGLDVIFGHVSAAIPEATDNYAHYFALLLVLSIQPNLPVTLAHDLQQKISTFSIPSSLDYGQVILQTVNMVSNLVSNSLDSKKQIIEYMSCGNFYAVKLRRDLAMHFLSASPKPLSVLPTSKALDSVFQDGSYFISTFDAYSDSRSYDILLCQLQLTECILDEIRTPDDNIILGRVANDLLNLHRSINDGKIAFLSRTAVKDSVQRLLFRIQWMAKAWEACR